MGYTHGENLHENTALTRHYHYTISNQFTPSEKNSMLDTHPKQHCI